ncbi:hypothetical protein A2U01_0062781, partial [Trifolium medium]|nr:hypothetical protein [Trifolium medium]
LAGAACRRLKPKPPQQGMRAREAASHRQQGAPAQIFHQKSIPSVYELAMAHFEPKHTKPNINQQSYMLKNT